MQTPTREALGLRGTPEPERRQKTFQALTGARCTEFSGKGHGLCVHWAVE